MFGGSTVKANISALSSASAGSTQFASQNKKKRHVVAYSGKEVVDVRAMLSDPCPMGMLCEGEYNIDTLSQGQLLFLFFLHM